MITDSAKHTLHLMNIMEINQIKCTFEEVKPYQNGVKRKYFNFNDWAKNLPENKNNYKKI